MAFLIAEQSKIGIVSFNVMKRIYYPVQFYE